MLNEMLVKMLVLMQTARREAGQGALEYMAMVVAMVTLIYIGFKFAGTDIMEEASDFVKTVLDES